MGLKCNGQPHATMRVCVSGANSEWSNVRKGVPQGSILGPLLFIVYVNDLPRVEQSCGVKQYADDTTLYASGSISEVEDGLRKDLEGVTKWVKENRLPLNVRKTQMMLLGRRRRATELEDVEVELDGQKLSRSRKVKCLGVWLDDELMWKGHVSAVRRKCLGGLISETSPTEK